MAECPWCHAQVPEAREGGPCARCGKYARDLRSTDPPDAAVRAQPAPARPVAQAPALEVPDLVVPRAPASRVSAPAKPAPAPFSGDAGGLDLQIDLGAVVAQAPPPKKPAAPPPGGDAFEDDLSAGPSIELDTGGVALPAPPVPISNGALPAPAAPASGGSLAPAPTPAPPPPRPPAIDSFEAQALADYGEPPDALWRTPLYAYRVFTRRAELGRLIASKRASAEASERRAEDGYVAFGERVREHLERNGGRGLEQVVAAEEVLRGRDGALAGAMDGHKADVARVDERLGVAEAELARAKKEESRVTALFEAANEDRGRTDGKLKRLDIEVRNAGGDPNARAAERSALAAELAAKEAKLAEAKSSLALVSQVTKAAESKVFAIRAEREAVIQRFGRQIGTRSEGVEDARKQVRAALAALGRSMLTDTSTPDFDTARAEVVRLQEEAVAHRKEVALHEAAQRSFYVGKVLMGVALIVAALVLLVILVLFPFIYRALVS